MILNVILILIILKLSKCSLVLDSMSQNTLYVSNYCPKMKNCIEGSHVICQYYNHRRVMGHLCKNYVKVTITPQMVQQILEGVNKIRMKLATGEETGKDKQPLPRAYGMMRMHWDSELATLAQVLADQCLGLREDNCRATEKFSNPSQIITLINFNAPHWEYLTGNSTEQGLNNKKIRSSINKAFKSLHAVKKLISANDINKCPVLEILPDKGSRSYLKLIRSKATHIGCGISAYTRSQVLSSGSQHIYNSIQLVCNVSDGPVYSQPIYTTYPPIPDTGFTEKCGCPEGYKDSMGCLCDKDTHGNIENTEIQWRHFNLNKNGHSYEEPCDDSNGICDGKSEPNVMVLPIFEIHDAPNGSYEPENNVEVQFHHSFGNASFIETSMEENEITDDEVHPEIESRFLKMHKNNIKNHGRRRAMPSKHRERKFNAAASHERRAEHFDHYSSMEDNIAEHGPENSDYEDIMAANDIYRDRTEEENSFLEILDHLERAVKNIELDGEERKIFDFKMRKIYEAALKSKAQHESEELENEFKKLTDYLKHKSDAELEDESVESDKEEQMFDYINRRDNYSDEFYNGIDDKLIHILSQKHHHKDDYFIKHGNRGGRNDENDVYTNYPASRKQEKINTYDKNIKEANRRKSKLGMRGYKSFHTPVAKSQYRAAKKNIDKKINDELHRKMTEDKRKMDKIDIDKAIKTFGRRTFSYPEHNARRENISPGYRRIFETQNARPTLPTMMQNYEKVPVEIIHKKKYLIRDRPLL